MNFTSILMSVFGFKEPSSKELGCSPQTPTLIGCIFLRIEAGDFSFCFRLAVISEALNSSTVFCVAGKNFFVLSLSAGQCSDEGMNYSMGFHLWHENLKIFCGQRVSPHHALRWRSGTCPGGQVPDIRLACTHQKAGSHR
ncbi:hypothetical protein [Delftia sp. PS-11]|uniref:hypothetical protein n=1 Tax=Delftia sp. PS-11 TaxID=2767222 RepID=UPI003AB2A7F4